MATDHESERPAPPEARIILRPLGSPLPLGFFAFSVGAVLLGVQEFGWVAPQETKTLAMMLLVFCAPLEAVSSILAFLARDSGAGSGMGLFAGSWVVTALVLLTSPPGQTSTAFGVFLLTDALAILATGIAAVRGKMLVGVLLIVAAIRFVLAACYELGAGRGVDSASAGLGLLLGAIGLYGALALLLEDLKQAAVLPTFRTGAARNALKGTTERQVQDARRDAGVRQRL